MKIIVNADGVIWNEYLPVLGQYGKDVIVVKYASLDTFRPAHDCFTYLLADPHKTETTGNAAKKEALEAAGGKLLRYIGDDNDVVLLTDNDPVSFYPYEYLKEQFRTRRIHLLSCLPFSYESKHKKAQIQEALSNPGMVHSLCLVELDSLLHSSDTQETMGRLQIRIRTFLQELLVYAIEQLPVMDVFYQYLLDMESGQYVVTDLTEFIRTYEPGRATAKGGAAKSTGAEEVAVQEAGAQETAVQSIGAQKAAAQTTDTQKADFQAEAEAQIIGEDNTESTDNIDNAESAESKRPVGKSPQPREVDISFKRPVEKPSFFARLFGRKK